MWIPGFEAQARRSSRKSFQRPARDGSVDFRHEADGFLDGRHNFAVVLQVVIGQGSATALFEPLFTDLIAADVEIPDFGRHTFEISAL